MKALALGFIIMMIPTLGMAVKPKEIIQFSTAFASSKLAVLPADESMFVGQLYRTSRESLATGGALIPTGLVKVVEVRGPLAFAVVVETGSGLSKTMFEKFEGPMAGDQVDLYSPTISKSLAILPDVEMTYAELFKDPRTSPSTFEIADEGLSKLVERIRDYASSNVQLILIEGYTDLSGSSDANQAESYQRALAVRASIIKELNFKPERVVAVGYGDGEQKPIGVAAESKKLNRRVIIRAINLPQ